MAADKHVAISHGQGVALTVTACDLVGERRSVSFGLGKKVILKRTSRKLLSTPPSFAPVAII